MNSTESTVNLGNVQMVSVGSLTLPKNSKQVDEKHVTDLARSFRNFGGQFLIQPLIVDLNLEVIDGIHRLEAAKQAGLQKIAVVVVADQSKELRQRIEIDSNLLKKKLSPFEIEEIWENHFAPLLQRQARLKQGTQRRDFGERNALTEDFRKNGGPINISAEAKKITGMSLSAIRQVSELKRLAARSDMPEHFVKSLSQALIALQNPEAHVGRIYRRISQEAEAFLENEEASEVKDDIGSCVEYVAEHCLGVLLKLESEFIERMVNELNTNEVNVELFLTAKESVRKILQILEQTDEAILDTSVKEAA